MHNSGGFFHCALLTSVSSIIFSASSSVSFSPTLSFTRRRICALGCSCILLLGRCALAGSPASCARTCLAVPRQSSPPVGDRHLKLVVTRSATMFVGRFVCWTVLSTRHGMCTSPFGRWCGPPTASRCSGPSVPWVSLPGPTGVPSNAQAGWHREQSANPLWLCCVGTYDVDIVHTCMFQAHLLDSCGC